MGVFISKRIHFRNSLHIIPVELDKAFDVSQDLKKKPFDGKF